MIAASIIFTIVIVMVVAYISFNAIKLPEYIPTNNTCCKTLTDKVVNLSQFKTELDS